MTNLRLTALIALVLAIALLSACFAKGLYPTPDAYVYYGLGKSIADEGHYGNLNWLDRPGHVKYPPLYPVMLAGVERFADGSVLVMNGLGALLLVLGVWALGRRLLRLEWDSTVLLLAAGLVIGNRYLQNYAWGTTSDVPFLGMIGLVALLFPFRRRVALPWWPLLGLLLSIPAIGVRMTGVVLLGALGLHLLVARRWREAVLFGLGCAAVLGAWIYYTRTARGANPDSYASAVVGGARALDHAWMRLQFVLDGLGRLLLPHADRLVPWPLFFTVLGSGAILFAFAHLIRRRPRGSVFLGALLAGNILLILVTSFYDHQRYLFPIFLPLVFVLVRALIGTGPRVGLPALACLALLAANLLVSGVGAFRSASREFRLWDEPPISGARVTASGAAQYERRTILAMMSLAEEWRGEKVSLVQCPSLRERAYAPLLLPGRVGWRYPADREGLTRYFESAAASGRAFALSRGGRLRRGLEQLKEDGRLKPLPSSDLQDFYTVYEYR